MESVSPVSCVSGGVEIFRSARPIAQGGNLGGTTFAGKFRAGGEGEIRLLNMSATRCV
jgi:hypothetical protein